MLGICLGLYTSNTSGLRQGAVLGLIEHAIVMCCGHFPCMQSLCRNELTVAYTVCVRFKLLSSTCVGRIRCIRPQVLACMLAGLLC